MMKMVHALKSRAAMAVLALGSGVLLTGCVVAPAYPVDSYNYGYAGADVYAPMAPPALRAEIIPIAPSPAYMWIGGSWGWSGSRYDWRPGRWAMPPRPGYGWQSRPWSQGSRGWHGGGGHWGRR